jgi:hypothetical protein
MTWTLKRRMLQALLGAIGPGVCACACLLGEAGCQQMAVAQTAVNAMNTAGAVAVATPKVATAAVQTAANAATATVNAVPGAVEAIQAGQGAVDAVQTTAQNAAATAGNAAVTYVPGVQEGVQAGQSVVRTAQNAGQTVAQATTQAISAIPGGKVALDAVPKPILDILYRIITLNKLDWGKPKEVYVADGRYIFIYPSNAIPVIQKSQPRIIVVDTVSQVERLKRLEKSGTY